MPKPEYRGPSYEVAEYSHAQKRIAMRAVQDDLQTALRLFDTLILDNGVPGPAARKISDNLRSALLRGDTLYEHEALTTNCRISFIVRK